jgi:F-type H+-transporting ATPase subunit epsilon
VAETIRLSILSPERRLVEGAEVEQITLTGSEGQIQILPGHAPMVGTVETGIFSYRTRGEQETVGVISSGFFEVHDDEVTVMAETLELQAEINVDRARKAQQLAEQTLRDADLDGHKFNKYQLKLQRSLIRQQIAGKEL